MACTFTAVLSFSERLCESRTSAKTLARELCDLLNVEGHRPGWFRAGENLRAISFAIHLEPVGQANDYVLPRNVAAEVLLELGPVIARLKEGSRLKPRFEGQLGGFDLLLELMETTAQTQEESGLGLCDCLRGLNGDDRGFQLRKGDELHLLQICQPPNRLICLGLPGRCKLRGGPLSFSIASVSASACGPGLYCRFLPSLCGVEKYLPHSRVAFPRLRQAASGEPESFPPLSNAGR